VRLWLLPAAVVALGCAIAAVGTGDVAPGPLRGAPVQPELECPEHAVRWRGGSGCWICGGPGVDPVTLLPERTAAEPVQVVTTHTAVP
jgi:hypothetical protein